MYKILTQLILTIYNSLNDLLILSSSRMKKINEIWTRGYLLEKKGCVLHGLLRLSERTQARSFVFFFPPLTVSMTRVHHASPDSLNWVRHFQWLDPSKSLAASSLQPSHPLVFVRENSEGLPTYPDAAKPSNTSRVAFVFTPGGTAILNLWYRESTVLGHRKTSVVSES